MANGYDFFSGTQEDINRRLLRKILALEAKVDNIDISDLEDDVAGLKTDIGDDTIEGTIKGRIKALETTP